jgi:GT2 family glycosyltransferase
MSVLAAFWRSLPDGPRRPLLTAAVGAGHLRRCAAAAAGAGCPQLACALLFAAWEEAPLDGGLAGEVFASNAAPEALRPLLAAVATRWRRPDNLAYYQRLLARRDTDGLDRYLRDRLAAESDNLWWAGEACGLWPFEGRGGQVLARVLPALPPDLAPLSALIRAHLLLAAGETGKAVKELAPLAGLPLARPRLLLAEALRRLNRREEALNLLLDILSAEPWRVNALLAASDLASGLDSRLAPLPGRLAVCLYTWNKAADLDTTLAALLASDLGEARVLVLDNGSTDATPDVLSAWTERAGSRLVPIRLPVNIGAPAARNWLAAREEVKGAEFAAFVDDDATLPPDWLGRLGALREAYPWAFAWGAKVVDASNPAVIQHVGGHLREEPGPGALFPSAWRVDNPQAQLLDAGQFAYARPCLTVTGCCHLLPVKSLAEVPFDIRFSPSQYDDLDRDLTLAARGGFAACTGHLAVAHRKASGKAGLANPAAEAGARGNRLKLTAKHPPEEAERLMREDAARLLADLLAKAERLDAQRGD